MAEYEMQEMNLPSPDGKPVLYPRLMLGNRIETAQLARFLSQGSTFSSAEVIGLLEELSHRMAQLMSLGKPVKLNGIGTFTPALALRKGKERESGEEGDSRRNAQSIVVGGIHFKPDKSFLQETNRECVLERSQQKFRRSSQKYTSEQRLELAQAYLNTHSFMRVAEYAALTGLCRSTASRELREWAMQEGSGISFSGWGTHKVYVGRE